MGAQAKKKITSGTRNDHRRSGKAWKNGKSPEVRQAEASQIADVKRLRKNFFSKKIQEEGDRLS